MTPPIDAAPRRALLLAMMGVCATVVLAAFDSTIVSTTLPRAAAELNGLALYSWVGAGYFVTSAVAILAFGRLGDVAGRKPLMLGAVTGVAVCSIACGLAQTMPELILFRSLQGVASGAMVATAFAAPADLFPAARERVKWMALVSMFFASASGVGPVLGGTVTQALGWRAAFFIGPLACVVALYLLARHMPYIKPAAKSRDGMVGALRRVHERREAMLINTAGMATGAVMFILVFYSPLLLQRELGYSPSQSGLLLMPQVAAISIGSLINGRLFGRQTYPQRLMVFGGALLAVGCIMVLLIGASMPAWLIFLTFFISGIALGFIVPNLTLFMQMLSERHDVGLASALVQTMRSVGSAVGVGLVGLAIAPLGVLFGIRAGLALCIALSALIAWIAHHLHMHNVVKK